MPIGFFVVSIGPSANPELLSPTARGRETNESAVTGKLYTRREKFVHTQPDRSTNRQSPGR
jgi:hypothetical protein